jgi:hypothetical protein
MPESTPAPFRRLTFLLATIFLGPPIGLAVMMTITFVMVAGQMAPPVETGPLDPGRVLGALGFMVFAAYFFGVLPALFHGLTMIAVTRAPMPRPVYAALSAISGGLWGLALPLVAKISSRTEITPDWWGTALPFLLVGLIPALTIALIRRFDIRPNAQ